MKRSTCIWFWVLIILVLVAIWGGIAFLALKYSAKPKPEAPIERVGNCLIHTSASGRSTVHCKHT